MPSADRAFHKQEKQQDLEQEASTSQASTEPLSFEDEDEDEDNKDQLQDSSQAMADGSNSNDEGVALLAALSAEDPTIANHSSAPTVGGDAFSDESELTDESEGVEGGTGDTESEEDDDEMGGGDSDDADDDQEEPYQSRQRRGGNHPGQHSDAVSEEEEGAEEEVEGDNADSEEDEEEAAEGLASLTTGKGSVVSVDGSDDVANGDSAGLNTLSSVAEADENSDSDSLSSSRRSAKIKKAKSTSRLNEVTVASDLDEDTENADGSDDEQDDDEQKDETENRPKSHSREMSSLGHLAKAAKRGGPRSAATGLLAGAPSITVDEAGSGAASASTSREASPKEEEEEEEEDQALRSRDDDKDDDKAKDEEVDADTPIQEAEETVLEEDPSTDEAATKRQEAMEMLTKIEIGFAVLRDKLYVERMGEVNKESEMILDGTHPDLIYLTNVIEARRERRLQLVERYFEQSQQQYDRVARVNESAAWSNWRNQVVQLRHEQMEDVARKRRRLDREKRTLDGPRPARRHQVFETELIRNPEYDEVQARAYPHGKKKRKVAQEIEDLDEMGAYVAYPDLRGAEDGDAWMDMERMGIQPDPRLMQNVPMYRVEEMGVDPYGVYMMEGQPPPDVVSYGGRSHGSREGAMMDRSLDGQPPHGYLVDEYGHPAPVEAYAAPPHRARFHADPYMDDRSFPLPSRKGPHKSPTLARPGLLTDERDHIPMPKSEGGSNITKNHHPTPPADILRQVPQALPHEAVMPGPPMGGAPYMSPYDPRGGILPPEDGYYGTNAPPPQSGPPMPRAFGPPSSSHTQRRPVPSLPGNRANFEHPPQNNSGPPRPHNRPEPPTHINENMTGLYGPHMRQAEHMYPR